MMNDDTSERLRQLSLASPRYRPGRFRFSFGEIEYVDAETLAIQYQEIFRDKLYDFSTAETRPFIVDCGGNIGLSVIRFKQLYPDCEIICYEADPKICDVLRGNLGALGYSDVKVESAAVWTNSGTAKFVVEGGEGGRLAAEGTLTVPAVRLADQIARKVDLLKMDIEGAEWAVLDDLGRSGALRHVRNLIVEFHGWTKEGRTLGNILTSLVEFGFTYTFPWSFCEPGLAGPNEPTPFAYAKDAKFILFLHAWRTERPDIPTPGAYTTRGRIHR